MRNILLRASYLVATVFGIGYAEFAPGTWGSLAGLILCVFLHSNTLLYIAAFVILFFFGVFAADRVESDSGIDDPKIVVIDEFACIFVVFLFIPHMHITAGTLVAGFVLFRIFDIFKIPPADRLEKIKGGWGIMLDDLMAGIYANLILRLWIFIIYPWITKLNV